MIPASLTLFESSLVIGLICSGGALLTSAWHNSIPEPTKAQNIANRVLFSGSFLGFLVFGVTPVFLWLLFL